MRWSRVLLVASLAAAEASLAGCSKSGPAEVEVVPGAPAGDVREVRGAVTAKRGDEPARPLAVGDVVSGDDVVTTGAAGSVVIELRHNGARWSLGGGQDKRVASSEAWKAARRGDVAAGVGERSTAAGRHAEREGADTAAGAVIPETASGAMPVTAPGAAAPPPPPAPAPAPARAEREVAHADEAPQGDEKTAAELEEEALAYADKLVASSDESDGESDMSERGGGGGDVGGDLDQTVKRGERTEPSAMRVRLGQIEGALSGDEVSRVVMARKTRLAACGDTAGAGTVTVTFTVAMTGVVRSTAAEVTGDAMGARDCVVALIEKLEFAAGDTETTVQTSLIFTE